MKNIYSISENKNFFYWYMTNSTDGKYLEISNIELVTVDGYETTENSWDIVTVHGGTYNTTSRKSLIHKTEKSALKYAIKKLKTSIRELKDPNSRVAPPNNHELWIDKANDKLNEFNFNYSEKYPEIFI